MNLSNQALFQEGLDALFDMTAYQNAISLIKLRRIGCFCSPSVRKVVEEKCVSRESTGFKGTTSSDTENSSFKLCIENMFNNTCSNNSLYNCLHVHHLMIKIYCVVCTLQTLHHDMILLCYM